MQVDGPIARKWMVMYETGPSKNDFKGTYSSPLKWKVHNSKGPNWTVFRHESGRWSFEINSYHLDWSKLVKILEYGSDVILILLKFFLTLKSFILRTSEITLRRSSLSLYSLMIQSKCKNL